MADREPGIYRLTVLLRDGGGELHWTGQTVDWTIDDDGDVHIWSGEPAGRPVIALVNATAWLMVRIDKVASFDDGPFGGKADG